MKKTLVFFCGLMSLNVIAQPIPVSSLGNVAYTVNENGTPIPNDTVITKNGKAPFIPGVNTFTPEQPIQQPPGFETPAQSNSTENQTTPETPPVIPQNLLSNLPSDVKELIKGKKTGTTINETNNSNSTSQTSGNSQGLTGVTLQTAPIVFSTSRGYIEDWNKTTLEEHTKKGEEITQKKYGEFINKK
jgi:hypothetical protein